MSFSSVDIPQEYGTGLALTCIGEGEGKYDRLTTRGHTNMVMGSDKYQSGCYQHSSHCILAQDRMIAGNIIAGFHGCMYVLS